VWHGIEAANCTSQSSDVYFDPVAHTKPQVGLAWYHTTPTDGLSNHTVCEVCTLAESYEKEKKGRKRQRRRETVKF